jgi:hypothetical protein
MAKLTLLEITQNILNAMDSDSVNSVDDTVESMQVAEIVKETYFDLMSQRDWPWLREEFSLEGMGDLANPTKMRMPDAYSKMMYVKYDKKDVAYVVPEEFRALLDNRVEQVGVVDSKGFVLNRNPIYYTSFDDEHILFDGYNSAVDDTLMSSKSVCYGVRTPAFTLEDSFIPDLPDNVFPTLLADAKATCFINLKQQANSREERRAQRGRVIMQNQAWRDQKAEYKYNTRVNYGRK